MKTQTNAKEPEIVLRAGKPAAVILDIEDYKDLLERAEDSADLKALAAMRKKPLKFKSLESIIEEIAPDL